MRFAINLKLQLLVLILGFRTIVGHNGGYRSNEVTFHRSRGRSVSVSAPLASRLGSKSTNRRGRGGSTAVVNQETIDNDKIIEGDPDSIIKEETDGCIVRGRSGNVGYMKLATPQWFRPIFNPQTTETGQFYGSIIILTTDMILMDTVVAKMNFDSELQQNQRFIIETIDPLDGKIDNKYFDHRYKSSLPQSKLELELIDNLNIGFSLFKITHSTLKIPNKFLIKWTVKYNLHGLLGRVFPEDKHARPDYGCFGFKYSKMLIDGVVHMVNTEYPLSIFHYHESFTTTVFANDGDQNYKPYSNLDGDYNSGSPVFCGIRGNLRYFARKFNETTTQLIPLHDIANDIKLASRETYDKLVVMTARKDKNLEEVGWMPDNVHPQWFRAVYRQTPVRINREFSWFAGSMIAINKYHFLISDEVAQHSLDPLLSKKHQWIYYNNETIPTEIIINSKDSPLIRSNQLDWPQHHMSLEPLGMSIYQVKRGIPGWRDDRWRRIPYIQVEYYYSEPNCYYLSHKFEASTGVVKTLKIPAFIVPDSCYDYMCYFTFEGAEDPAVFKDMSPIMCNEHLAFILLKSKVGPANKGRLALHTNYLALHLMTKDFTLFNEFDLGDQKPLTKPYEYRGNYILHTGMTGSISNSSPPRWLRILLNNSPNHASMLGYSGLLSTLDRNEFIASDYGLNDALLPDYYRQSGEIILKPKHDKTWVLRRTSSPKEWEGYHMGGIMLRDNGDDFPILLKHMADMNMDLGAGRQKFSSQPDKPKLENCSKDGTNYIYLYNFDGNSKLVFSKFRVTSADQCSSKEHCFSPIDPFNPLNYIGGRVHSGAPVQCADGSVMGFLSAYPDGMNRAKLRFISSRRVLKSMEEAELKFLDLPSQSSGFLFEHPQSEIQPPPPSSKVAYITEVSQLFFVGPEQDVDRISRQPNTFITHTWAIGGIGIIGNRPLLFTSLDGGANPNDRSPIKRIRINDTGLALYQSTPNSELKGGVGFYKGEEAGYLDFSRQPVDDCYTYIYRPSVNFTERGQYHKIKVSIKSCNERLCYTRPYLGMFRSGAPIECGNYLAYVFIVQANDVFYPQAIKIVWINQEMFGLRRHFNNILHLEGLDEVEQIRFALLNRDWLAKILPLNIEFVQA